MYTNEYYIGVAATYNSSCFGDPRYINWLGQHIIEDLAITGGDKVVDLGGGTGIYSLYMLQQIQDLHSILCVDPSQAMLNQIASQSKLKLLCEDANTFCTQHTLAPHYNKFLINQVIHHISDKRSLLTQITDPLPPTGRLLIVSRTEKTRFPLFSQAVDEFNQTLLPESYYIDLLQSLGLQTILHKRTFTHHFSKDTYFMMIRQRFWSNLKDFSTDAIEQGIQEIDTCYPQTHFKIADTVSFIVGFR